MYFKLFNFLFYMTAAAFSYVNLYFKEIGLSSSQIGFLNSIPLGISLFFLPLWGVLSDYLGANRKLLFLATGGATLFSLMFLYFHNFMVIGIIMTFFFIFQAAIMPLADSLLLGYLGPKSNTYGNYRLWGSIGFILVVTLFGYLLDHSVPSNVFYIYGLSMFFTCLTVIKLPGENANLKVSNLKSFKLLATNHQLGIFLLYTLFIQLTLRTNYTFFPLYFQEAGGSKTLLGIALTIAAASEILVFLYAKKFLKYIDIKYIFFFSSISYTTRWLIISLFSDIPILLGSQLLHSFTFGLFHVSAVYHINNLCGEKFKASGQNLYATVTGISAIIGNYVGGFIYDWAGGAGLYLTLSIVAFIAGMIYYIYLMIRENKYQHESLKS